MERKKLIKLAKFILIILVAIILVENSIRGVGIIVEKKLENDKKEEQLEKYQNSESYKETVMLEKVISELVELLNNNETDLMYDLIDENYKDYKFQNNKELFEEYIKNYVNNDSKITLQTYEKINGRYICRLLSENSGSLKSFVVLVTTTDENKINNIILDDITSIEKTVKFVESNGLRYRIKYIATANQTLIYEIEFTNIKPKDINYTINNIKLRDTSGNMFNAETKDIKLLLKPGESIRESIFFYDGRVHNYPKTMLEFSVVEENGKENNVSIYVEEGI